MHVNNLTRFDAFVEAGHLLGKRYAEGGKSISCCSFAFSSNFGKIFL